METRPESALKRRVTERDLARWKSEFAKAAEAVDAVEFYALLRKLYSMLPYIVREHHHPLLRTALIPAFVFELPGEGAEPGFDGARFDFVSDILGCPFGAEPRLLCQSHNVFDSYPTLLAWACSCLKGTEKADYKKPPADLLDKILILLEHGCDLWFDGESTNHQITVNLVRELVTDAEKGDERDAFRCLELLERFRKLDGSHFGPYSRLTQPIRPSLPSSVKVAALFYRLNREWVVPPYDQSSPLLLTIASDRREVAEYLMRRGAPLVIYPRGWSELLLHQDMVTLLKRPHYPETFEELTDSLRRDRVLTRQLTAILCCVKYHETGWSVMPPELLQMIFMLFPNCYWPQVRVLRPMPKADVPGQHFDCRVMNAYLVQ